MRRSARSTSRRVTADILQTGRARTRRCAGQARRRERRRQGARQLQSAAGGIQSAAGKARRAAPERRLQPKPRTKRRPTLCKVARRQDPAPRHERCPRRWRCANGSNVAGDKENPLYDDAVRDAVKTFQTERRHARRRQSWRQHRARHERREARGASDHRQSGRHHLVNMERWRWMPRDLGNDACDSQHSGLHADACSTTASFTGRPRSWSASPARRRR